MMYLNEFMIIHPTSHSDLCACRDDFDRRRVGAWESSEQNPSRPVCVKPCGDERVAVRVPNIVS